MEVVLNRKEPVRSYYVDVSLLRRYWGGGEARVYHHTPPMTMLTMSQSPRTRGRPWEGVAQFSLMRPRLAYFLGFDQSKYSQPSATVFSTGR